MTQENLDGQVTEAPEGTTDVTPESDQGQSFDAQEQTTQGGPVQDEETFFDPASIQGKPELEAAYKQMQAAFTKKTQSIASQRERLKLLDSFERDPIGTLQSIVPQYGYTLTPAQQREAAKQQEWNPDSWDDVLTRAREEAKAEVMKELNPMFDEVKTMKRTAMESYMDNNFPDWRLYEDQMTSLLGSHPTLAKDPETLYRMAVPENVLAARAAKKAVNKMQSKASAAQTSGGSTTPKASSTPKKARSFSEAVALAKQQLAEQGIHQ